MVLKKITACAFIAGIMVASASTPAFSEELTGTLKKIKDTGVMTLGVRESSIPFSYMDSNQTYQGYSIDICNKITEAVKNRLGMQELEVKTLPITSSTRIPLTVNGTIDITCGSDANNLERQKQVAFTMTTYVGHTAFVAKKADNIQTVDDLKGKTVVSTSGSTDVKLIADLNKQRDLGMKIVVGPDHMNSFMMVDAGRATAFVMTDILVASLVASSKNPDDYSVRIIDSLPVEPWSLMLRRDDPQFKQLVDGVLVDAFKSGEMKDLYKKWFQSTLPSLNVNLNIPMSRRLEAAMASPTDSGDPADYQ